MERLNLSKCTASTSFDVGLARQARQRCNALHSPTLLLHGHWRPNMQSMASRRADHKTRTINKSTSATVLEPSSSTADPSGSGTVPHGVEEAKAALRAAVAGTSRGGGTSRQQRGPIEEAQLAVEAFGGDVDYDKLPGLWRLIYTTAADVAPIVALPRVPLLPLEVGDIFQRFSSVEEGVVENIIKFSVPGLLHPGDGITAKVRASYEVQSPRRIALRFRSAGIESVRITPGLEALLAPALLPRTWLNHRILLGLKELNFQLPLPTATALSDGNDGSGSSTFRGSDYLLTFLDDDMLVGRAQGTRGSFIFMRA